MTHIRLRRLLLTGAAAIAAASGGQAAAQTTTPTPTPTPATPAGFRIENTARATYTVNGATQTVDSNTASFVVDRKVNLTVARLQDADTQVALGEKGAVTRFRVTNNTNGTQDILLDPDQNIGTVVYVGTDNFDMANLKAFVDDGDGIYDPDKDTATWIDELEADGSKTVFLVGDVPTSQLAQLAIVNLHATVAAGGAAGTKGARLLQTTLNIAGQDDEIDVVFADNDSDGIGRDLLHDGEARAYLAYNVGVKNLDVSVVKSARVVSDGISTLNPKALPGAVVEYCLAVKNDTPLIAATNVSLADTLPANVTYVDGSLSVGGVGASCLLSNGVADDDDADDATPNRAAYDRTTRKVTATIASVPGGATINASFRVTIN